MMNNFSKKDLFEYDGDKNHYGSNLYSDCIPYYVIHSKSFWDFMVEGMDKMDKDNFNILTYNYNKSNITKFLASKVKLKNGKEVFFYKRPNTIQIPNISIRKHILDSSTIETFLLSNSKIVNFIDSVWIIYLSFKHKGVDENINLLFLPYYMETLKGEILFSVVIRDIYKLRRIFRDFIYLNRELISKVYKRVGKHFIDSLLNNKILIDFIASKYKKIDVDVSDCFEIFISDKFINEVNYKKVYNKIIDTDKNSVECSNILNKYNKVIMSSKSIEEKIFKESPNYKFSTVEALNKFLTSLKI